MEGLIAWLKKIPWVWVAIGAALGWWVLPNLIPVSAA